LVGELAQDRGIFREPVVNGGDEVPGETRQVWFQREAKINGAPDVIERNHRRGVKIRKM
jgi:hypothetical protein